MQELGSILLYYVLLSKTLCVLPGRLLTQVRSCVRSRLTSCLRPPGCQHHQAQHLRIDPLHRNAWQQQQAVTGLRELLGQLVLLVGLLPRVPTGVCCCV